MFTHTVLFRFDDPADASESKRLLETLPGQVQGLDGLWVGLDVERTPKSWDLVLVTTHASREDYRTYAADPDHLRITEFLRERMTDRAVVDAEGQPG
ncbi:MAG TPA: Dabb family protein [Actinomycetes bacterium]